MYYRQPRYYDDFRCIGGSCINICCFGWNIVWTKEEIEKVKNAEGILPELKELVEKSFVTNSKLDGKYVISLGEEKRCPFQTAERLCKIQKELGAEYLSFTCASYPRHTIQIDKIIYRNCSSSCPEVLKTLLNNEHSTNLINVQKNDNLKYVSVPFNSEKIKIRPELQYNRELLDFYYELISDKKIPVETAIILGALAAQKLTELAEKKQQDRIPEALKAFRKQFHNPDQLKSIENIKPNYYLKLGFMAELMEKVVRGGMTPILHDQTGTLNIDIYNKGEEGLREALKGREFFLRNLALNLLFEFNVPFIFEDSSMFENYSVFATAFGMLKLNLIATCVTEEHSISYTVDGQKFVYNGDDKLIGITSLICRRICQDNDKAKTIIELLNSYKFTTPAYLALLVK